MPRDDHAYAADRIPPANDPSRYVYVTRLQCPRCGSVDLRVYRTEPERDDGSIARYTQCKGCKARFVVVAELAGA